MLRDLIPWLLHPSLGGLLPSVAALPLPLCPPPQPPSGTSLPLPRRERLRVLICRFSGIWPLNSPHWGRAISNNESDHVLLLKTLSVTPNGGPRPSTVAVLPWPGLCSVTHGAHRPGREGSWRAKNYSRSRLRLLSTQRNRNPWLEWLRQRGKATRLGCPAPPGWERAAGLAAPTLPVLRVTALQDKEESHVSTSESFSSQEDPLWGGHRRAKAWEVPCSPRSVLVVKTQGPAQYLTTNMNSIHVCWMSEGLHLCSSYMFNIFSQWW